MRILISGKVEGKKFQNFLLGGRRNPREETGYLFGKFWNFFPESD
jgi:hypothetical protein